MSNLDPDVRNEKNQGYSIQFREWSILELQNNILFSHNIQIEPTFSIMTTSLVFISTLSNSLSSFVWFKNIIQNPILPLDQKKIVRNHHFFSSPYIKIQPRKTDITVNDATSQSFGYEKSQKLVPMIWHKHKKIAHDYWH